MVPGAKNVIYATDEKRFRNDRKRYGLLKLNEPEPQTKQTIQNKRRLLKVKTREHKRPQVRNNIREKQEKQGKETVTNEPTQGTRGTEKPPQTTKPTKTKNKTKQN